MIKNAKLTLDAGCNILLHCNGKIDQMKKLSLIVPEIDNFTNKITQKIKANFYKFY
jgi:beta-glucosidase-like glycosyl hydrolase